MKPLIPPHLSLTAALAAAAACGASRAEAAAARTVLDLQDSAVRQRATIKGGEDGGARIQLIRPNRRFDDWYVLSVARKGKKPALYHLENPFPNAQRVRLTRDGRALVIKGDGAQRRCEPWRGARRSQLERAARGGKPFTALCDGRLYLRNPTVGDRTSVEWAVDFFRRRVRGGEDFISFVKDKVFKDSELIKATLVPGESDGVVDAKAPPPPRVAPAMRGTHVDASELGIATAKESDRRLVVGKWYQTKAHPRVFVSAYLPDAVPGVLLSDHLDRVDPLDRVERRALVYMIAFDLDAFDVGYALGTDNPELAWSERTPADLRRRDWPGPDGVRSPAPLVSTGLVNPIEATRVVATFTGGFKRKHSVFRTGVLGARNGGTHYGFLSHGVVFSRLWPGLSTSFVDAKGRFGVKTWTEADNRRVSTLRHARQNGLPLIEWDRRLKEPVPGRMVKHNFAGNWSGNKDNSIRTLRAGLCWLPEAGRSFLVYGYFSGHTPSAMARVFQAYGCRHAMHLDMNMPRHVYLSLHRIDEKIGDWKVEQVTKAMRSRDLFLKNRTLPRFIGAPDNRDFFYLTAKAPAAKATAVRAPSLESKAAPAGDAKPPLAGCR